MAICGSIKSKMAAILDIKNNHNFATGLPIDVMFVSRVGFPAELRWDLHTRTAVAVSRVTLAAAGISCFLRHPQNSVQPERKDAAR